TPSHHSEVWGRCVTTPTGSVIVGLVGAQALGRKLGRVVDILGRQRLFGWGRRVRCAFTARCVASMPRFGPILVAPSLVVFLVVVCSHADRYPSRSARPHGPSEGLGTAGLV